MAFVNNTVCCLALAGSLLVYLTDAQGYRQQEVLYGRVHGVGTEFFFIPGDEAAIGDLDTAYVLGISGGYDEFRGQTSSQRDGTKTTSLWTSHLVPYNTFINDNDEVNTTRILRFKDGHTSEYVADVLGGDTCFGNIRQRKDSTSENFEAPPPYVAMELQQICQNGFSALSPARDLSVLDGSYTGSRLDRTVSFTFQKGEVMNAGLVVGEVNQELRIVLYYPLCDGVIAAVLPAASLESENISTFVVLRKSVEPASKKSEKRGLFSFFGRRSRKKASTGEDELDGLLADDDESNVICKAEHVMERIARYELLDKWDRYLSDDFVLETKRRKLARS
ncbi:hypothetical protein FOZ63_026337 [Perkinsus olseni]|uniref:Uncharacterized protein n=1 Tax=Perkinsus olseni TaxID=32597 RepID=A0A7J6TB63_PEROL|nr:hypothetical protein FOZ63_026337 [Perkinsus olseni]